jgi:hypothetical protein
VKVRSQVSGVRKVKIRVQAPPQRGSAPAGGPDFNYPQRGFSLPAFNYLRSTGVLEWWSNGKNLFFIALRKQIPGKNLKV